jgi:hypothetical protein
LSEGAAAGVRAISPRKRTLRVDGFRRARTPLWLVLLIVLALVGALLCTNLQRQSYRASAEVLIEGDSSVLPILVYPPRRVTNAGRAQALQARDPGLARRVAARASIPGITATKLLAASRVTPSAYSSRLRFSVSSPQERDAILLASTYATEFVMFQAERDRAWLDRALHSLNAKARSLEARGATDSKAYVELLDQQAGLKEIRRLLLNQTTVIQPPMDASRYRPHQLRNGILGAALGALLGIVALGLRPRARAH